MQNSLEVWNQRREGFMKAALTSDDDELLIELRIFYYAGITFIVIHGET